MAAIVKAAGRPGVILVFDFLRYQAKLGGLRFREGSFVLNCFGDIFVLWMGEYLSEIFPLERGAPNRHRSLMLGCRESVVAWPVRPYHRLQC